MRTTKRFTPSVLRRFEKEGRGTGTYQHFLPQHRVTRGDPASSGRSHIFLWRNRQRDLLSDGELHQQLFATMLPDVDDVLEQKKLDLEPSAHLLADYGEASPFACFPGTLELAQELGIRHPRVSGDGETAPWVMSSDLVLVFKRPNAPRTALAMAFKTPEFSKSRRTCQLLKLEREYWVRRGVPWLLITPDVFERSVALTLRRIAPWSLGDEVSADVRELAARTARECPNDSVTHVLQRLQGLLGSLDGAQRALWQAIWYGVLPVDLRRGWRPHIPLRIISESSFRDLNPIAARRSAWN
jgi:hypothetical protein